MKKHQLSRQYRLTTPQDIGDKDDALTAQFKQGALFGLVDTASGDCVVINSTMHLFLKAYETPKTLDEITDFFASAFGSTPQEVRPITQPFFKEMKKRGVLLAPKAGKRIEIIEPYPVGSLIDHYRIEEILSVNLPLEVYKVTDVQKQQPAILKILRMPAHLSQKKQKKWRKTFKKEFTIQKILMAHPETIGRGHPHICALLDLKPDYAVLGWIDGISLRRRLAEGEGLDATLRDVLLSQILGSYAFMHDKKILHGDVHANNILLSDNAHIHIIDFDLAHRLTHKGTLPRIRGGVPEFIPPENIRFDAFDIVKGKANYRTEVYQLGIVAYWATFGKMPFTGDTWQDLATDILNKEIDFCGLSSRGEAVSPHMSQFLKKSLDRNPKNRFASAKEMNAFFLSMNFR